MSNNKPNLIYVMCDELRQQALGFMDKDPVYTPNLDAFAQEGLVLTDAVSNYPVCSPYRGMLFTGKYPFSTGIVANCNSNTVRYGNYLKKNEICFSDILEDIGYYNGYIGKWQCDVFLTEKVRHDCKVA